MAFFGLTYLGPQNTFASAAADATSFHVFDMNDLQLSWKSLDPTLKESFDKNKLYDVLKELYKGPIPSPDKLVLDNCFSNDETFTFSDYTKVMIQLKEKNEKEIIDSKIPKSPSNSKSNYEYRDHIKKHIHTEEFKQVQRVPLSANQEVGWEDMKYEKPVAGKQGSEITKFAAELVKNGIYY